MTLPSYETLTYEADGHLRLVGLNRAAKRNAFNVRMLLELSEAFTAYENDADARCLLLFAHGEHFTAGLDLAEVGPHVATGGGLQGEGGVDPLDLFGRRRTKPVVIALQGYAFTIGIELCLACDVRVAASDTKFNQLEVGRGIIPFGGATLRFAQVAGWGNAMRWMLTGDFFDASEALRIGLVQQVTAPGEQVAVARAIATTISNQAPLAVQATLRASRTALESGPEAAKAELMSEARRLMATEDAAEGVKSFVERRKAVFQGR
jgi:enoyl-CoA hydratase/carnithine racemase